MWRKIFRGACAKCFILMYISICAQHAKIYPIEDEIVYTRSFRKRKKFLFTLFPNGIFMRTMFHVFNGMCFLSESSRRAVDVYDFICQLCRSVEGEHILFFPQFYIAVSWVPFTISVLRVNVFSSSNHKPVRKENGKRGEKFNSRQNEAKGKRKRK